MKRITEFIIKGVGFAYVYLMLMAGISMLLGYDLQTIGYGLICSGVFGLYQIWLFKNNYFVSKKKGGKTWLKKEMDNGNTKTIPEQ
jgi:hypothetical protein